MMAHPSCRVASVAIRRNHARLPSCSTRRICSTHPICTALPSRHYTTHHVTTRPVATRHATTTRHYTSRRYTSRHYYTSLLHVTPLLHVTTTRHYASRHYYTSLLHVLHARTTEYYTSLHVTTTRPGTTRHTTPRTPRTTQHTTRHTRRTHTPSLTYLLLGLLTKATASVSMFHVLRTWSPVCCSNWCIARVPFQRAGPHGIEELYCEHRLSDKLDLSKCAMAAGRP
jgi:hypothetical protein